MPRPGPRPYVCERRVWHSERHQPMRGSLIQEIFRLVNENHSSVTKKNKEWQEKLPVVVLKAEEIMYSKANSEGEYMDLKSLWDRTNDAINIIIRRDESSETGKLLQPCIEAALNLGCTPRRTSRSERNSNPMCYLSPVTQKAENALQLASYPGIRKPTTTMNVTQLGSESQKHIAEKSHCTSNKFPFASEVAPSGNNQYCLPVEKNPLSSYPVYPHYAGNHHNFDGLQHGFGVFPNSVSNKAESSKMGQFLTHELLSLSDEDFSKKINLTDVWDASNNQNEMACDLSLRLGPVSTPSPSVGNSQPRKIEGSGSASLVRNKFSFLSRPVGGPMISSSNEMSADQSEYMHLDAAMRKRKTVYGPTVNRQFRLPPKLPYNHFAGKMKTARS